MRKFNLTLALVLAVTLTAIAQSPQALKYQAVVRNSSGDVLTNQLVALKISILQNGPTGTVVYSETHLVSTNQYGLVTLSVGYGAIVSGDFTIINWGDGSYYLQAELDETGGSNYQFMGTSQ